MWTSKWLLFNATIKNCSATQWWEQVTLRHVDDLHFVLNQHIGPKYIYYCKDASCTIYTL